MDRAAREGRVEVVAGVMFSGKSEEVVRRLRAAHAEGKRVQLFRAQLHDRPGTDGRGGAGAGVGAGDGVELEAKPIGSARRIAELVRPDTEVVGIDQAHFLDDGVVRVVNRLAGRGVRVIVAGTDLDFRGAPFGPMPELLATAERVDKLHAICARCGAPATRSQRLVDGEPAPAEGPTIQVGGRERYEPRCRACHELPKADRHQIALDIESEAAAWASRAKYW